MSLHKAIGKEFRGTLKAVLQVCNLARLELVVYKGVN